MKKIIYFSLMILVNILILSSASNSFAQTWYWPVPDAVPHASHVTSGRTCSSSHGGIDIWAYHGAPIIAAKSGTVIYSDYCPDTGGYSPYGIGMGCKYNANGSKIYCEAGNFIVIYHEDDGTFSHYAHLSQRLVSEGVYVHAGQVIGKMGNTGNVYSNGQRPTGPNDTRGTHLHFSIKSTQYGGDANARCDFINNYNNFSDYNANYGKLDINGILDGVPTDSLVKDGVTYGTANIYLNNTLYKSNQPDFFEDIKANTPYRIVIKPNDGFAIDYKNGGQDTYSGTVSAGQSINISPRLGSVILVVNGNLDGKVSNDLGKYGTFDLMINNSLYKNDAKSFNERVKYWSEFELTDIKANPGYEYKGFTISPASESIVPSGRLMEPGTTTVTLRFETIPVEPTEDWTESDVLPSSVNTSNCDIEYKNHYVKTAKTSPDVGYTVQGVDRKVFEPNGNTREDYRSNLGNSSTLVQTGYYYYHYCRPQDNVVNYERTGDFQTYHGAGDNKDAEQGWHKIIGQGIDNGHEWYQLQHVGRFNNALAWCNDGRNYVYYRMYRYEERVEVTYYTWVKDSGWQSTPDPNATSVSYRYRLKVTKPTGISLDKTAVSIETGKTTTLAATVSPTGASNKVTWSSSDTSIASIAENGLVTGYSVGTTTITATADGNSSVKATCKVTVTAPKPIGISLDKTKASLEKGKQLTLIATITPSDAGNKNVIWSSDKPEVADVTNGIVTAKAVGTAIITATSSGNTSLKATFTVTVTPIGVIGLTVQPDSASIYVNDTLTLTAVVTPSDAENKNVIWSSSNANVASVQNGVVKGNSAGTAIIYATSEVNPSIQGVCTVTVNEISSTTVGRLVVSSANSRPGNEVTIGVSFEENPGFVAAVLGVNYDKTRLSLLGFEDSGLTGWTGPTTLVWVGDQDTTYNGEIVKLKFKVLENAAEGDAFVTIICDPGDIGDMNENQFIPEIQAGKVTVKKYMPGDMNGDNKVNAMDLIRLKRYLGGEAVTLEAPGDVNNDKRINAMDLIRLKRYLGGEAVEIY